MKMAEANFFEWQRQFGSETNCLNHIKQIRWPNGFICPRCSCEHGYELTTRDVYECRECNLFHGAMMIPFRIKSSIFNDHGYMNAASVINKHRSQQIHYSMVAVSL